MTLGQLDGVFGPFQTASGRAGLCGEEDLVRTLPSAAFAREASTERPLVAGSLPVRGKDAPSQDGCDSASREKNRRRTIRDIKCSTRSARRRHNTRSCRPAYLRATLAVRCGLPPLGVAQLHPCVRAVAGDRFGRTGRRPDCSTSEFASASHRSLRRPLPLCSPEGRVRDVEDRAVSPRGAAGFLPGHTDRPRNLASEMRPRRVSIFSRIPSRQAYRRLARCHAIHDEPVPI